MAARRFRPAGRSGPAASVLLVAVLAVLATGPVGVAAATTVAGAETVGAGAGWPGAGGLGGSPGGRVPWLAMPLRGRLVRGFDQRAGPYGPGHRGIALAAPLGTMVTLPASGTVSFAGPVAGVVWVTVQVAPGVMVTLGPLADLAVSRGLALPAGAPLGRMAAGYGGALYLGLRVDGTPVDPLPWLLGLAPPRLVPLSGPPHAGTPP